MPFSVTSAEERAPVGEDLVGAIEDEGGAQQGRPHHLAPHRLDVNHRHCRTQPIWFTLQVAQSVTAVTSEQL